MMKRTLAWLLCLAMLLSFAPGWASDAQAAPAAAAESGSHTAHDAETWQAWDKADALPAEAGSYYLTGNVTLTQTWEVTADIKLCLNGYAITQTGADLSVANVTGALSVSDCTGKNGTVTGGKGAFRVSGKLALQGVTVTGNTAENGSAILAQAGAAVQLTDSIITGNTAAAGAAVFVAQDAKLTVSGDVVIAENTNAANTADVVLADKLYVNELTGGSNLTIQTTADQTDAANVIAVEGQQTAIWQAGWVTYMKLDGTEQDLGYITAGEGKAFVFGHYHGDQKYTAYDGGANHNLMKTGAGYYYLTADIIRSTTSSGHLSLDKNVTQHLCLNGHRFVHRKPSIRLYLLDAGDKLYIEDCTSYRNEKDAFIAGGIFYEGASKSTVADGSAIQVAKGGQLTLENIKISGFTSTKSAALRVLGETANRGVLNMTNVELSGNSNDGTTAVLYANTGSTVNMTDCVIRGNSAASVGAINTGGDAQMTITDCLITENTANAYGTVNIAATKTVIKLVGATRVTDNKGGNLHLQAGAGYVFDLNGLTQGASVGITLHASRIAAGQMHFTGTLPEGVDPLPYCFSDNEAYKVRKKDGKLILGALHEHCVPGHENCESHENVSFTAWTDATKLPETPGFYYLTTDVVLENRAAFGAGEVVLCLNGHTVKPADSYDKARAFYLRSTAKLTLTDCNENPGVITGFKNTAITCDGGCTDARIDIYNIAISDNTADKSGAGIALQGTSALNLYSGKLENNRAGDSGSAIYASGKATINLLGGQIAGNSAANSGAGVYANGKDVVIHLSGTDIENNEAKNGAGMYVQSGSVEMTGGTVSGNKATENCGGIFLYTGASMQMTGGEVTGNSSKLYTGGVSVQADCALELSGEARITDNTADGNFGGVYVHASAKQVKISGNVQITGNQAKGVANNMHLLGDAVFTAEKLGEQGSVGISASKLFRVISTEAEADVSAGYFSDNKSLMICYRDKALHLDALEGHTHCACAGEDTHCDHALITYAPWEQTNQLPTNGYWYLTGDVTVKSRAALENDQLHLCLNGHTVQVQDTRAFYLRQTSKLTLTDCNEKPGVITGARASAIMFDGNSLDAELNIHNITLSGNSTTSMGGAVMVQGKSVFNLYSGTITENTAQSVLLTDAQGNPVLDEKGNQQLKDKFGGGAVGLSGKIAVFNMYGGTISNNKAIKGTYQLANGKTGTGGGTGGAVYCNGIFNMYGGQITGNTSDANAGGIQLGSGMTFTMEGGKISDNTGNIAGGVLIQTNATFLMKGGEISGNSAKTAGGVYMNTDSHMIMEGGEIVKNTATEKGGGLCAFASTVELKGGKVNQNTGKAGGGVTVSSTTLTVNGEKVNKPASLTVGKDTQVCNNHSTKNAGGVYVVGKDTVFTLDGGSVSNNTAKEAAGGVLIETYAAFVMKSGKVSGNSAKTGGGAYISTNTSIKMSGGSISSNTANDAGGIVLLRAKGTFSGGTIGYNTAKKTIGGMYLRGSQVTLSGTYIAGNTAQSNGGGITTGQVKVTKNGVTTAYPTVIDMYGGAVTGNQALNGGGFLLQVNTTLNLYGGTISENEARANGGGAYVSTNAAMNMTGGAIRDNKAKSNGGAVFHLSSVGSYTGGEISGNTVGYNGSVFYGNNAKTVITVKNMDFTGCKGSNGAVSYVKNKAAIHYENCKFYGNETTGSGAVYLYSNCIGSFKDCQFYDNKAASMGGALYASPNTKIQLDNCTFTRNSAEANGGAIMCRGNLEFNNCEVYENTSAANGGGISTGKCGTVGSGFQIGMVLNNTVIRDNRAAAQGGGLYLSTGCRTTMNDVTITGNTAGAEGGGYWAVDDTLLNNVTVTGNTSGGQGYAAWYDYSIFDGHSYFVGVHKLQGDIIIKDNEGGDLYLDRQTAMAVTYEGLGEKTDFNITLDSGVLTNRLYGQYDYQGGNLNYTVTYGDRSLTEPEVMETLPEETEPTETPTTEAAPAEEGADNTLLYAGIGGIAALLVLAAVILVVIKKKKAPRAESK